MKNSTPPKVCNARLRSGDRCQSTELLNGDRCQSHGGLSTGPKTYEGRKRSALNIGKNYDDLLRIKLERVSTQYARVRVDPTNPFCNA